jgi:hypothetical protein
MKVIGAGWGRTGTTSTLSAIEQLGFGPCYTFFTLMSQKPEHIARWLAAYAGEPTDWPDLFSDFNSVVDWPACDFLPELLALWPDAKVVLNVREPEGWYTSMRNTIWKIHEDLKAAGQGPDKNPIVHLGDVMLWDRTFHGRFLDKDYAIGLFERHNREIIASLPPEKLLVYNVTEGWEPLCRFLEVPVPEVPFPRLNDTATFHTRAQRTQQEPVSA